MSKKTKRSDLCPHKILTKISKGELVLSTRRTRSKCWSIFAMIEDQNGDEVKGCVYCRICKNIFSYSHCATTNLLKHKCYKESRKPESPTRESTTKKIKNSFKNLEPIVVEDANNNLTNLLTKWLIKYCTPYDLIEDAGLKAIFQEFLVLGAKLGTSVDIDELLPSSANVAININEVYDQRWKSVKTEIAALSDDGFSLVADSWTDIFSKKNYLTLTVQFLKNGVLKCRLLGLRSMEGEECTSQHIHAAVELILNDFDCKLSSKSIIVTKGKENFTEAFKNYDHVPCLSHLLNTALRTSFQQVPEITELARASEKLVNFLKNSPLNFSFSSPLQSYCPSRWNTLYNMLVSLENNWNEITATLNEQNEQHRILAINRIHLKAVIKTLQPFEEAIKDLEEENSSTLHLVWVYLHELRKSCDTNDSEFKDFDFIESLKEKLRFHLDDIVTGNGTTLYKLALFLYPPTNKLLQFSDTEKQFIEAECMRLMKRYESELKPIIKQEFQATTSPVCKRKRFFSDFVEVEANCDADELIKRELQCYKYVRVINSDDFDVFSWWEQQRNNFPLLYKLSCAILATPASTASVQRIFSAAASLLCENTSDLGHCETNVEQIMFINSNSEQDDLESEFEVK